MKTQSSHYLKAGLKIALVAGLLYFLTMKGFISIEATKKGLFQWDQSGPAMIALFLLTFFGALRWQWLLQAQGIHLPWVRTLQLHFIGQFFNIALPGAVSGDLVKAFYVAHEAPGMRGRAFGSILFDRVAGVSALVLVSAGALFFSYRSGSGASLFKAVELLILISGFGVICFYTYLFFVREHHDPVLRGFRTIEKRFSRASSLTRIYEGLRHYHNHRWVVFKVFMLSIGVHLVVAGSCLLFAHALGDATIDPLSVFVVVPLGLLVTAVPIFPAGIGTGHAAFGWLFLLLGSQRGADVFSLFALLQLLSGSIGGLVYLRFRSHEPKPVFLESA